MQKLIGPLAGAVIAAALVACGGGSSSGSGNTGGQTSGGAISPSQSWATASVSSVNGGVSELVQAGGSTDLPTGFVQRATAKVLSGGPRNTTVTESEQCSLIGSSGSGSISYSITVNGSTPVSATFTYNECSWTSNGTTYTVNGSGTLTYSNFTSDTDFSFTFTWTNLTFDYSSGSYNSSGKLNGSESCTLDNSSVSCSYTFGNYSIGTGAVVSTSGGVTTVSSATVTTTVSGASGTVTITYADWVYNATDGYATSGTVTITDSNGDSATITANGGGSYTVKIVIGGSSTTYTVTTTAG